MYVQDYFEKEGVALDSVQITKDPRTQGLCQTVSEFFLGKLGQSLNLKQKSLFMNVK